MPRPLTPRFVCSFAGKSDYQVGGDLYAVRHRAFEPNRVFCADYWQESVIPGVGTVRRCSGVDRFPPAEVVALFPGFVGARFNLEAGRVEYDGAPPKVARDRLGLVAVASPTFEFVVQ
jgi:hypothetical protein